MTFEQARCLFVCSTGRVGTLSLSRWLGRLPGVDAEHEPSPRLLEATKRAYQDHPLDPDDAADLFRRFATPRHSALDRSGRPERWYVETSNRWTYLAPVLARHLPASRFLHLHRNPTDVVRSGMRRGWYVQSPWDPYRIVPRPTDPAFAAWSTWSPFEKCCWYWAAVNRFSREVLGGLAPERVMTLSSDGLFQDSAHAVGRIASWLKIPVGAGDLDRAVDGLRHNAESRGAFPRGDRWPQSDLERLRAIAGPEIRELGYDRWLPAGDANAEA